MKVQVRFVQRNYGTFGFGIEGLLDFIFEIEIRYLLSIDGVANTDKQ